MTVEYTGTHWKCINCKHKWSYNDDACPECGSDNIEDDHHELFGLRD